MDKDVDMEEEEVVVERAGGEAGKEELRVGTTFKCLDGRETVRLYSLLNR